MIAFIPVLSCILTEINTTFEVYTYRVLIKVIVLEELISKEYSRTPSFKYGYTQSKATIFPFSLTPIVVFVRYISCTIYDIRVM